MPYGLRNSDLSHMINAFSQFEAVTAVVLFGSRAKGNYQPGSDVDLAVKGGLITHTTVNQLSDCLNEEKPLPYFFDIVHFDSLSDVPLLEHIERVGIVIFEASQDAVVPASALESEKRASISA
jgi:uncharacterized protein